MFHDGAAPFSLRFFLSDTAVVRIPSPSNNKTVLNTQNRLYEPVSTVIRPCEETGLFTFAQPGDTDVGENRTFWCLYSLRRSIKAFAIANRTLAPERAACLEEQPTASSSQVLFGRNSRNEQAGQARATYRGLRSIRSAWPLRMTPV